MYTALDVYQNAVAPMLAKTRITNTHDPMESHDHWAHRGMFFLSTVKYVSLFVVYESLECQSLERCREDKNSSIRFPDREILLSAYEDSIWIGYQLHAKIGMGTSDV